MSFTKSASNKCSCQFPFVTRSLVTACPYVSLCSSMSTGDWDLFSWYWRGRRLVELTEGCYSKEDSNGLPGWIKQPPCPWDAHYQFSIKSLLSNSMWTFAGIYVRPATVETIVAKQCVAVPTLGYSKPNKRLDSWHLKLSTHPVSWFLISKNCPDCSEKKSLSDDCQPRCWQHIRLPNKCPWSF